MADVTLSGKNPASLKADALVVGTCKTSDGLAVVADQLPAELVHQIESLAPQLDLTGARDEVRKLPAGDGVKASVLVLTGLGEREADGTFAPETLRRASGAALRVLAGTASAAIALPTASEEDLAAVVEGALFGAYTYTEHKTGEAVAKQTPVSSIEVVTSFARSQRAKAAVDRARVVAEAVHGTRDLVNTPANLLFPASFADAAKAAVKNVKGVKVTVLDEKQLAAGGYGGIVGVGQGSSRPPRLVKVSYTPSKPTSRVALVGKGITFDTGGISIKPAAGMQAMTMDMAGAAVVLHTVVAAARLGLGVAVTAYLCLAENMPGSNAQRPGDVVKVRGGKTVEVINTDAEGRMVMADGIVAAIEDGHDTVIDIATLTGAAMVALGTRVAGVFGDDDVREALVAAAGESGESVWPMPIPEEMRPSLKSNVADLANIAGDRWGGALVAAAFLKEFAGETPWGHIDIAGPAFNEKAPYGYTPAGGTGHGVRTLLAYLESQAG